MKEFLFYCPRCGYEKKISSVPKDSVGNCRGGFGRPIFHSACPQCGNLDAGCIEQQYGHRSEIETDNDKYIISLYQNVRTTDPYYSQGER